MYIVVSGGKYLSGGKRTAFGTLAAAALSIDKETVAALDRAAKSDIEAERGLVAKQLAECGLTPALQAQAEDALALIDELIAFRVYMRRWLTRLPVYTAPEQATSSLSRTVRSLEQQLRRENNLRRTTLPTEIHSSHEFIAIKDGEASLIAEKLSFDSMRELLLYDLFKAVESRRPPRCCSCCGRWFVPGRKNEIYCSGLAENGKPCREFGAAESFKRANSSELRSAFNAARARIYTRKSRGKLSAEEAHEALAQARLDYEAALAQQSEA